MGASSTPQSFVPSGPSAEQLALAQLSRFAGQPNSLAGILSGINRLTTPTKSPNGRSVTNLLLSMPQAVAPTSGAPAAVQGAQRAYSPAGGTGSAGSGGPASTASTLSQYASLGKSLDGLSSLFGGSVPSSMAGTALGGAGLPSGLTAAEQASLSSAFTGAPVAGSLADAMGLTAGSLAPLAASALAPVGTGAITAAGNAAGASAASELASALGATPAAPAAAAPAAAATPAASGAGGMGLGALAADAGALAAMGYAAHGAMTMPANNGWGIGAIGNLIGNVRNATHGGLINPAQTTAGSIDPMNANGTVNQPLVSALQSLNQLQLGNFGQASPYVQQALNGLGYHTIAQQAAGKPIGRVGAPVSTATNLLRRRF